MTVCVLDSSVAIAWAMPDERSDFADSLLAALGPEPQFVVPAIWLLELANAVIVAERRERISASDGARIRALLARINPDVAQISVDEVLGPLSEVALGYKLTAYDATYVYLARREALPLATLDVRMADAARAAGIAVME